MKKFRVENKYKNETITVLLYQAPYEDENILNKTSWKQKDVIITEITMEIEDDNN